MTEPMTMNRVIHGAVRRDLVRLSNALALLPDGDRSRAADLERAFANLRRELTHHHEGEDDHVWPTCATLGLDPDLLSAMESEHHRLAEALAETSAAMSAVASTGSAEDARTARQSAVRTRTIVEQHLSHEEHDLEPQLQPFRETPEWKAAEKQLRWTSPGDIGRFFAWLTDGMKDDDREFLRRTVPPAVVFVFARVFGRTYTSKIAKVWRT